MRKIFVDCLSEYNRVALLEDGVLQEIVYSEKDSGAEVGDILVGRVEKILPSKIAFVNIGEKYPVFLQLTSNKEKENTLQLKQGKDVIIQIEKEAYKEKRAVATTCVSITGKYTVVIFDNSGIGISKKITSTEKREELKNLVLEKASDGFGIILRTNCENAPSDEIIDEIDNNKKLLLSVLEKGQYVKSPAVLYKDSSTLEKTIRDLYSSNEDKIIVNDEKEYNSLKEKNISVELYSDSVPMFHSFFIEEQLDKLFQKKVWLKSGGYLIIDETEAMSVIDVNSGKAVSNTSFVKTNLEAAQEIARQIRLRNLSGMIIVDFINTKGEKDNENLLDCLRKYIGKDRIKTRIIGMTELGLMQLTRQKIRRPLSEYIYCECPYCKGSGKIIAPNHLAEKIKSEVMNLFTATIYTKITINSNVKVINAVKQAFKSYDFGNNKIVNYNIIETARADYYEIEKSK